MKFLKQLMCAALAVTAMLCGVSAFAADTTKSANLMPHISVFVEGNLEAYCWNEAGKETYYLNYENTPYAPIRTVAEWMGKDFAKGANGKTFTLSGSKTPVFHDKYGGISNGIYDDLSGDALIAKLAQPVSVTVLDGATLTVDGTPAALVNANGGAAAIITWDGEPYISLYTAAKLLNMEPTFRQSYIEEGGVPVKNEFCSFYLRTKLTQSQLCECQEYACKLFAASVGCEGLYGAVNTATYEAAEQTVAKYIAYMHVFTDTPKPDYRLLDALYPVTKAAAEEAIQVAEKIQQMIKNKEDLEKIRYAIREDWTCATYGQDDPLPDDTFGLSGMCASPMLIARDLMRITFER